MKYDVNVFDKRCYLPPFDEVGFDKFAVRINILFFATQEIVGAYDLVSRLDELVDQPGAHKPRPTRHQHSLGFQNSSAFQYLIFVFMSEPAAALKMLSMHVKCFGKHPSGPCDRSGLSSIDGRMCARVSRGRACR